MLRACALAATLTLAGCSPATDDAAPGPVGPFDPVEPVEPVDPTRLPWCELLVRLDLEPAPVAGTLVVDADGALRTPDGALVEPADGDGTRLLEHLVALATGLPEERVLTGSFEREQGRVRQGALALRVSSAVAAHRVLSILALAFAEPVGLRGTRLRVEAPRGEAFELALDRWAELAVTGPLERLQVLPRVYAVADRGPGDAPGGARWEVVYDVGPRSLPGEEALRELCAEVGARLRDEGVRHPQATASVPRGLDAGRLAAVLGAFERAGQHHVTLDGRCDPWLGELRERLVADGWDSPRIELPGERFLDPLGRDVFGRAVWEPPRPSPEPERDGPLMGQRPVYPEAPLPDPFRLGVRLRPAAGLHAAVATLTVDARGRVREGDTVLLGPGAGATALRERLAQAARCAPEAEHYGRQGPVPYRLGSVALAAEAGAPFAVVQGVLALCLDPAVRLSGVRLSLAGGPAGEAGAPLELELAFRLPDGTTAQGVEVVELDVRAPSAAEQEALGVAPPARVFRVGPFRTTERAWAFERLERVAAGRPIGAARVGSLDVQAPDFPVAQAARCLAILAAHGVTELELVALAPAAIAEQLSDPVGGWSWPVRFYPD